jgi:hypothetical protein
MMRMCRMRFDARLSELGWRTRFAQQTSPISSTDSKELLQRSAMTHTMQQQGRESELAKCILVLESISRKKAMSESSTTRDSVDPREPTQ